MKQRKWGVCVRVVCVDTFLTITGSGREKLPFFFLERTRTFILKAFVLTFI